MGMRLIINEELCVGCGNCAVVCPINALELSREGGAKIIISSGIATSHEDFCEACGTCLKACAFGAIDIECKEVKSIDKAEKIDEKRLYDIKYMIYEMLKKEKLSISDIAQRLGKSAKEIFPHVYYLKDAGLIYEHKDNEITLFSTEKPKKMIKEEESAVEIVVDEEKAKTLYKNLEMAIRTFSKVKSRFLIERGDVEKIKSELRRETK